MPRGRPPPVTATPDNPSQTWSGRGRRPRWVREAEAKGLTLEDLRAG
ncbi:H-NS family nucleoid-associated regulatory protein [Rubellimicrobium thermophilum]